VKRRDFITLLGGAAAPWPLAAGAQPSKVPTIGFLGTATPLTMSSRVAAFVQRLRELGWIENRTVAIEYRWAEGRSERFAYDVLLYSAQRVGDVVRMQRSDIRNGVITVVQEKTGAKVFVPLHPALIRSIKAGPSNGFYLIGDMHGRPIKRARLSALISSAVKAAGLSSECVAHGLRKAALRRLAEGGSSSKEIQAVSGHRTLGEIERYTRDADQRRLAAAAMMRLPDKD
jgi:integrase